MDCIAQVAWLFFFFLIPRKCPNFMNRSLGRINRNGSRTCVFRRIKLDGWMFKASACEMEFPCCARKRIEFRKIVKGTCVHTCTEKEGKERPAENIRRRRRKGGLLRADDHSASLSLNWPTDSFQLKVGRDFSNSLEKTKNKIDNSNNKFLFFCLMNAQTTFIPLPHFWKRERTLKLLHFWWRVEPIEK